MIRRNSTRFASSWFLLLQAPLILSLSACGDARGYAMSGDPRGGAKASKARDFQDSDYVEKTRSLPVSGEGKSIGESCRSNDPGRICLALKYVAYRDVDGLPTVTPEQVLENLADVNAIWNRCGIAFEVENYSVKDPTRSGLSFRTTELSELSEIRRDFEENHTMLVVTTGEWSGSLGAGSANAWSTMPGRGHEGVVLEKTVAGFGNIVAHELGHMLNLDHAASLSEVMSGMVGVESRNLSRNECSTARATAESHWIAARR